MNAKAMPLYLIEGRLWMQEDVDLQEDRHAAVLIPAGLGHDEPGECKMVDSIRLPSYEVSAASVEGAAK